jgi:phosphinothricin acetyltransferase
VTDTIISLEEQPPDEAEMARRIEQTSAGYPWLVAEDGGTVVGYAYASKHHERAGYRWAADVAVYVEQGHQRKGFGGALYDALLALLARQGVRRICAGIGLPNEASVTLHESRGFQLIGTYRRIGWKLGAWHDVGWWELELPGSDPPAELGPPARLDQEPSSSSSSASVGHASTARRANPSSSGGTSAGSRIG